MAATVVETSEISLNGVYYLVRSVQPGLASVYPERQVIGDVGRDSNPNASVLALSSWQGGIGVYQVGEAVTPDRSWWSTCQQRYKNNLVLPGLAVLTAASGVSGSFNVGTMGELNSEIYAAFGTSIRKYNNTTDSWGSSLATLPAVATDAITFRLNDVVYLAFATTGGYTYTSDGVTWTDDTTDTLYMTFWNDGLWGIDSTGQLWASFSIGNESNEAQLPLPDSYVTDLFVARDAAGDPIIYASTKVGLYAHDFSAQKFVETELKLPLHPYGGNGSVKWRDSTYVPAGLGVYQYINGANSAVITIVGPDRDDGLPSDQRGTIKQLIASHNDLLAIVDATTAPGTALDAFDSGGLGSHMTSVIEPDIGYSSILGWNGVGWEVKWLSGSTAKAITSAYVSNAYSVYRLWWALGEAIYYMRIPADIINPSEVTDFPYATSGEHITPWFNVGQMEIDKLALRLRVDTLGLSSTETVTVAYGLNLSTSWTSLGAISSDGITTYEFPNSATPTGTEFRWIRWKLTFARGSTTTLSPSVRNLTLEHRKKLLIKRNWQVVIDITRDYKGNSPMQQRAALLTAVASNLLLEFTLRDDASGDRNYYVDAIPVSGLEFTGHDERGQVTLLLVER